METYVIGSNKLTDAIKQAINANNITMILKNKRWIYNPHANSIITTITLEEYSDVRQIVNIEDRDLQLKYNSEYQTYIFPIGDTYGIFKTRDASLAADIYVKLGKRDDKYSDCSNNYYIDTNCFCINSKSYVNEEEIEKLKPNIKYIPHKENYYNNTHSVYMPLCMDHELFKQLWSDSYVSVIRHVCDMFMLPDETPANYRVTTDHIDLSITINKPSYKLINSANPEGLFAVNRYETEINRAEYDNIMFIFEKIKQEHDKYKVAINSRYPYEYPSCDITNNSCYERDGKFYIQFTSLTHASGLLQEIHFRFTNYTNKFSISTVNFTTTGEPIKDSPNAEIIDCLPKNKQDK